MKTPDFGMPALIELADIGDCVSLCLELGLKFIEINMNMPQYQLDRLSAGKLERAAKNGIYFTFHLDERLNAADFNSRVAKAYTDTALDTIELCKAIGAPVINMHMDEGVEFKLPERRVHLFERYSEYYLDALRQFRDNCERRAGDSPLKICIENCNGYPPFIQKGVELLLESDAFGLTLDIGHSFCANAADEHFILSNKDRLRHMHIHDARDGRCHLVLGEGDIKIRDWLSLARNQACRCVVETKSVSGLRQSVAWLRENNI